MGETLGGCGEQRNGNVCNRPIIQNSLRKEFALKESASSHIEVHAFLILERVAGSKEFLVSVLLQADRQFIGKTSLGAVAEGQEILLSLRWDQAAGRFVASSQVAGSAPVKSFIPFAWPGARDALVHQEFSMTKSFVLNADGSSEMEAHENQN
jgi:hypothetical protein